jgi:hypothetical protein
MIYLMVIPSSPFNVINYNDEGTFMTIRGPSLSSPSSSSHLQKPAHSGHMPESDPKWAIELMDQLRTSLDELSKASATATSKKKQLTSTSTLTTQQQQQQSRGLSRVVGEQSTPTPTSSPSTTSSMSTPGASIKDNNNNLAASLSLPSTPLLPSSVPTPDPFFVEYVRPHVFPTIPAATPSNDDTDASHNNNNNNDKDNDDNQMYWLHSRGAPPTISGLQHPFGQFRTRAGVQVSTPISLESRHLCDAPHSPHWPSRSSNAPLINIATSTSTPLTN